MKTRHGRVLSEIGMLCYLLGCSAHEQRSVSCQGDGERAVKK